MNLVAELEMIFIDAFDKKETDAVVLDNRLLLYSFSYSCAVGEIQKPGCF